MTTGNKYDPFQVPLKTFTALTLDLIRQREYGTLKICFGFVERYLISDNTAVRLSLYHSFIPSLHSFLQECEWKQEVVSMFPQQLRTAYCEQATQVSIKNDYVHFTLHLN